MTSKHSDARKEQWRVYNANNRESRNKRALERIQCECGATHSRAGKTQHMRTKKHREYLNRRKDFDEFVELNFSGLD